LALQKGQEAGTNDAGQDAADSDFVRNDLMLSVNEGDSDQAGEKRGVNKGQPDRLNPKGEPAGAEKDCRQEFDQKITCGDRGAAIPAFATKVNPGQQGDVQKQGDGVFAGRAMGPG
jgi:hypothetical protein